MGIEVFEGTAVPFDSPRRHAPGSLCFFDDAYKAVPVIGNSIGPDVTNPGKKDVSGTLGGFLKLDDLVHPESNPIIFAVTCHHVMSYGKSLVSIVTQPLRPSNAPI